MSVKAVQAKARLAQKRGGGRGRGQLLPDADLVVALEEVADEAAHVACARLKRALGMWRDRSTAVPVEVEDAADRLVAEVVP